MNKLTCHLRNLLSNCRGTREYVQPDTYSEYEDVEQVLRILRRTKKLTCSDRVWVLSCWYHEGKKTKRGLRADGIWYGDYEIATRRVRTQRRRYRHVPTSVLWQEWKMAEEEGYNCMENVRAYEGPLNPLVHMSRGAFSYYARWDRDCIFSSEF